MADSADPLAVQERPPSDRNEETSPSDGESSPPEAAPADLMVVSRARRSNAGNRLSTLLAKSAEEEQWGEEWEEVANEEEFVGDEANDEDDYNLDSSSSEEGDDDGDEEAGEKEFQKAERQERIKKRKIAANPFSARLAANARKRVKLHVPPTHSSAAPPRPKKKSERASWIPTEEDGPIRTSSRRQTMANKETTLAKLKEKDRRRDDTLAMMKAAEARKAKDEPKPLTQAERLAQAARLERINSKSLHRWEELEEQRAAERQAKLDALKNRQIEGPFIRMYSGPAIWVDDKIKYTGKDAPPIEQLEEKLNKEATSAATQDPPGAPAPEQPTTDNAQAVHQPDDQPHPQIHPTDPLPTITPSEAQPPDSQPQPAVQDESTEPQSTSNPDTVMFGPPVLSTTFLYGMEEYAQPHQPASTQPSIPDLPPNPFLPTTQPQLPNADPTFAQTINTPTTLLSQFTKAPTPPPQPPRRKTIRRALRNLLILSAFPDLDTAPPPSRLKTAASLLKEKDRAALIQLSTALFGWSHADATTFISSMLNAPRTKKEREALARPRKALCAISNKEARYRDPETGIAYRDSRAFGVLRGVVGGGFVWCGELGCYVGGRAKPMQSQGMGFLGTKPAMGVPRRFLEMEKMAAKGGVAEVKDGEKADAAVGGGKTGDGKGAEVKTEETPVIVGK